MATLIAKLREFNEATESGQVSVVLRPHLSKLMSSPRSVTTLLKGMSSPVVALKVLDALQADGFLVGGFSMFQPLGRADE